MTLTLYFQEFGHDKKERKKKRINGRTSIYNRFLSAVAEMICKAVTSLRRCCLMNGKLWKVVEDAAVRVDTDASARLAW